MPEDNKTICRRLIDEVINRGNLAEVDKYIASNYIYHGPDGLEIRGPDGFKQMVNLYRTAFPDMQITVEDLIAEGDKVVSRCQVRGTHRGTLFGIAPTSKTVTITGLTVSRFANGKVVEDWESYDQVGMFRQLGVQAIPAPAIAHA